MKISLCMILALFATGAARAQKIEKVQPAGAVRSAVIGVPRAIAREYKVSAKDFFTFRDPQWSTLTIAQIGAATADAVTSLNNLKRCPGCTETGISRFVVGEHPDAHKYIVAGIAEISVEALGSHYFRNHGPTKRWYWRMIWTLPQSLSLYEHAHASYHNAGVRW